MKQLLVVIQFHEYTFGLLVALILTVVVVFPYALDELVLFTSVFVHVAPLSVVCSILISYFATHTPDILLSQPPNFVLFVNAGWILYPSVGVCLLVFIKFTVIFPVAVLCSLLSILYSYLGIHTK